jgi:hypothetical protein
MRRHLLLLLGCFIFLSPALRAQKKVYTIPADSVKITYCDSAELILENHTQNVPGFLFNTGNGRTIFKRGSTKLNDSLYLIGADTLNLGARSWVQGGNQFGATGVLGTLDNNHLDFYTNGQQRARLTNTGNLNIGVATVTSGGSLINTNAVLYDHVVSDYHGYQVNDIYVSRLENIFYNWQSRFDTSSSRDGDTVTWDIKIPASEFNPSYNGIVYPAGKMCFSFWESQIPQEISVMVYANDYGGRWVGPFTTTTNLCPSVLGYMEVAIPGYFNYVTEVKITLKPRAGGGVAMDNLEYILQMGAPEMMAERPYIGRMGDERIYNALSFYNRGGTIAHLSGWQSSYFLAPLFVGANSNNGSGNNLQVTGGMNATGNVQFSGLTGNNSLTRVLVSDGSGNLYYRDASTLAASDAIRSSLAVNGPIKAKRLTLTQHDWPDYVFQKDYSLPTLPSLERYIDEHHHLPGITPAADAEKKGVDVGENQAALLKKIEELTLYVIQQNKKLEAQDKKITVLSKEVKRLSAKSK